jgi:hypothetical protein
MRFFSTRMPSSTSTTGMLVRRDRSSSMTLLKSGDRCCTTTNAMPVSSGIAPKNCSSASSPPAEAPTPTTNNSARSSAAARSSEPRSTEARPVEERSPTERSWASVAPQPALEAPSSTAGSSMPSASVSSAVSIECVLPTGPELTGFERWGPELTGFPPSWVGGASVVASPPRERTEAGLVASDCCMLALSSIRATTAPAAVPLRSQSWRIARESKYQQR